MANMFNEDGTYNKTEWKTGDKITAVKLNKIESSLEAINNNDIDRHVEADNRLDILEERMANTPDNERMDALEDMVKDNKDAAEAEMAEMAEMVNAVEKETDQTKAELQRVVNYKNKALNLFEYCYCQDPDCNGSCGKVKGDGIHDDTSGIQRAIDYCWDNNIGALYFPIPDVHYTTTAPIHLWSSRGETCRKKVALIGDGKELTKIVKITNTTSTLRYHKNIDAVLILVNDYLKNDGELNDEIDSTGKGICRYNEISGLSFCALNRDLKVQHGVYSIGWYFARFTDIQFDYVVTAMQTLTWNCYTTYNRLRFNLTKNGCNFGTTQLGGQTTMLFQDCHSNGLDGCVFNIRGNATFLNCAIDGGGGTHYKIDALYRSGIGWGSGKLILINCHHESPSVFANNHLFDIKHGSVYVYTSSMEIPSYNFNATSSVIKLSKGSRFILHDSGIGFRLGVAKCPGMLVDKDATSQFILDNSYIDREMFEVYKHYVYNESDCFVLSNRAIDIPMVKGVSYASGTIPVADLPTPTITRDNTRLILQSDMAYKGKCSVAFIFTKKIDLTNMSKINISGDVDLGDASGTTNGNFRVILVESLPSDNFQYRGTPMPTKATYDTDDEDDYINSTTNYSKENANKFVDITDIIGEYYVGILMSGRNVRASIKEIKILR